MSDTGGGFGACYCEAFPMWPPSQLEPRCVSICVCVMCVCVSALLLWVDPICGDLMLTCRLQTLLEGSSL